MAETTYNVYLKSVRIAPRKVRLVADLVRGKPVQTALEMLKFTNKRGAPVVSKLLNSAIANAQNKATVDIDRMFICDIWVDGGATLKRWMPRAQGSASAIHKRTSHITLKIKERA